MAVNFEMVLEGIKPFMQRGAERLAAVIGDSKEADAIMARLPDWMREVVDTGIAAGGGMLNPFKPWMFTRFMDQAKAEALAHFLDDAFDSFTNHLGRRLKDVDSPAPAQVHEHAEHAADAAFHEVLHRGKKRLSVADIRELRPDLYEALSGNVVLFFEPAERDAVWDEIRLYVDVPDLLHLGEVEALAGATNRDEFLAGLKLARERSFLTVLGAFLNRMRQAAGAAPALGASRHEPVTASKAWNQGTAAARSFWRGFLPGTNH